MAKRLFENSSPGLMSIVCRQSDSSDYKLSVKHEDQHLNQLKKPSDIVQLVTKTVARGEAQPMLFHIQDRRSCVPIDLPEYPDAQIVSIEDLVLLNLWHDMQPYAYFHDVDLFYRLAHHNGIPERRMDEFVKNISKFRDLIGDLLSGLIKHVFKYVGMTEVCCARFNHLLGDGLAYNDCPEKWHHTLNDLARSLKVHGF